MTREQKLEVHLLHFVCPEGVPLTGKRQLELLAKATVEQKHAAYQRALVHNPLLLDDERWFIFTPDQVASLNAYQACGQWHPFTCGNHCGATLVATVDGWICPTENCGYTQDWAHGFMADWSWKDQLDQMHKALLAAKLCPHGIRDGVGCIICDTDGSAEASAPEAHREAKENKTA